MLALLIAMMIFLTLFLLIVKRWIAFSVALLLLISFTTTLIINQLHFNLSSHTLENEGSPEGFHTYMLEALENLKMEVSSEKENLHRVMGQVQEIFNSMDIQKQKIQTVIEEARERFKTDHQANLSSDEQPKESKL